jgi:hypothetical protein
MTMSLEQTARQRTPVYEPSYTVDEFCHAESASTSRTADWQWKKTRKSFMRAVGREKLK